MNDVDTDPLFKDLQGFSPKWQQIIRDERLVDLGGAAERYALRQLSTEAGARGGFAQLADPNVAERRDRAAAFGVHVARLRMSGDKTPHKQLFASWGR